MGKLICKDVSLSYLLPLAEASGRTGQVLPKTFLLFCRPLVPKDNNNKETEQNRNQTRHQNFNILCIFIFSAKHILNEVKSLLPELKKTEELAAHDCFFHFVVKWMSCY